MYKKINEKSFKELHGSKNYWYADPFLIDYNKNTYLFTEAFNEKTQVGEIAVSVLQNGSFSTPEVIIKNKYHMSYPNVFVYDDVVYMLPETGEGHMLELYKAVNFPNKWEKYILKCNAVFADSTVFIADNIIYILAYDDIKNITELYILNIKNKSIDCVGRKQHIDKNKRPAGNLFYSNDILYRPTQNCKKKYGESIIINRVENFEKQDEVFVQEITANKIGISYSRVHTLNFSNRYMVVDAYAEKAGIDCFIKRAKRKLHKLKI